MASRKAKSKEQAKYLVPHRHRFWHWLSYNLFSEVLAAVAGVVGFGLAANRYWTDAPLIAGLLAFIALLVFGNSVYRAFRSHWQLDPHQSRDVLQAILCMTYVIMTEGPDPAGDEHKLRICLFVPLNDQQVQQLTDYVGDEQGDVIGRKLQTAKGLVGKVARSRKPSAGYSAVGAGENRLDHLINNYGYTPAEAESLRADRQSWGAVPVTSKGKVLAILYADSADPLFWTPTRQKIFEASVVGVVRFLEQT